MPAASSLGVGANGGLGFVELRAAVHGVNGLARRAIAGIDRGEPAVRFGEGRENSGSFVEQAHGSGSAIGGVAERAEQ